MTKEAFIDHFIATFFAAYCAKHYHIDDPPTLDWIPKNQVLGMAEAAWEARERQKAEPTQSHEPT